MACDVVPSIEPNLWGGLPIPYLDSGLFRLRMACDVASPVLPRTLGWLHTVYLCSGCLTFACDEASWIITKKKKQYIRRPMSPDSKHYLAMEVPLLWRCHGGAIAMEVPWRCHCSRTPFLLPGYSTYWYWDFVPWDFVLRGFVPLDSGGTPSLG